MTAIRSDKRQRFLPVVRDVDRRDADSLLQRAQLVAQLEAHLVVEVRHRLVEQQAGAGRSPAARPSATRWRWPPDSCVTGLGPKPSSCSSFSMSATRPAIAAFVQPRMRKP